MMRGRNPHFRGLLTKRTVYGALALALLVVCSSLLTAATTVQDLRIDGYTLVGKTRISRLHYRFTYSAKLTNRGTTDISGATGTFLVKRKLHKTRDALGRLTQKTETIGGVTDVYNYAYDTAGQLTDVTKNSNSVESYGYDDNGNRISATVGGGSVTATYDDQDRLTQYGTATYAYNGAGDLLTKTSGAQTTTYQYDQQSPRSNVT